MESAAGLCLARAHYEIEIEHYLLKLAEQRGTDFDLIAKHFSLDVDRVVRDLNRTLDGLHTGNARSPAFSPALLRLLSNSWVIASINYDESRICTGHTVAASLSAEFDKRDYGREWRKIDANQLSANYLEIVRASSESASEDQSKAQSSPMLATRFFISYRRRDSGNSAGRLYDHLVGALGRERVFMDVASLDPGQLFAVVLADAIDRCDVVLAVIGNRWNMANGRLKRRLLDDENDWVRMELLMAIEKGKRIIPCLVDGASPPKVEELPEVLADVARRQVLEVSQGHFERDIAALLDLLKRVQPGSVQSSKVG